MDLILETPRLRLRRPTADDLDDWAALDAEDGATRFIGGVKSRAQARQGLRQAMAMWSREGFGLWSVIERGSGAWVGRVGAWVPKDALGTEIGWALRARAQGQGYATEAALAAVAWAFETLGWAQVIHCIDPDNHPSIALALRLGSRWLRSAREADGKPVEVYGRSRAEWRARSGA